MPKHDQFEELSALAATGQLSPDEEQRLNEHLGTCDSCRAARDEFATILHELPATEHASVDRALLRQIDEGDFRKRFLERGRAEGHRFSEEAQEGKARRRWAFLQIAPLHQRVAAAIMLGILLGAFGYRTIHTTTREPHLPSVPSQPIARENSQNARNDDGSLLPKLTELRSINEASQKTISSLKTANAALITRLETLEKQFETSKAEKDDLKRTVERVNDMNAQLSSQMEQNTQALAQTRAELEKAGNDREAVGLELAAEKAEVNSLSQQVRLQTASLDQDKQLLLAGRDVRDLMGARSLHIIDVHDADASGKDHKSFGRVFYTEGKSLIFYAFDLDEKKLFNAKYTFEAWGERLGQPGSVKSLGILYADDKAQKRWALKVDDPRQLAQIDSVFVTLEPQEAGNNSPRGKRILYAFLAGQPNHP
jgi:hypothetical protein